MNFLMFRGRATTDGTIGQFCNDDETHRFYTIEPEHPMPVGTFNVRLRYSPSHGYAVPGWLDVPGHDNIEMHPGNTKADTKNCVCPGDSTGQVEGSDGVTRFGVLHSRVTFAAFMAYIGVPEYKSLRSWDDVREFRQKFPGAGDFTVEIRDAA